MDAITKKYFIDDITVVWQPAMCIHSGICFKGLPGVFDPRKKPWVNISGATTGRIIEQVEKCPSGALSYYRNNATADTATTASRNIIEVVENGPLLVHGSIVLRSNDVEKEHENKVTAFCRCGSSANKPYCDGSHIKINFKG